MEYLKSFAIDGRRYIVDHVWRVFEVDNLTDPQYYIEVDPEDVPEEVADWVHDAGEAQIVERYPENHMEERSWGE